MRKCMEFVKETGANWYVLENIMKSLKKYNQKGLNAVIILL